jgi:hypothetical protein
MDMKSNLFRNILLFAGILSSTGALAQFAGGNGTAKNPYRIVNATQLDAVRNYTGQGKYFVLASDIDLSAYLPAGSEGWRPIANSFNGHFDGDGYKIIGLWINRDANNVGLFQSVAMGASISNLGVEIDPAKSITGNNMVGGLVGTNYGAIINCYVTGSVAGNSDNVGGLIGFNYGGCIFTSFACGKVRGAKNVGGLVGNTFGYYSINITDSYAASEVTGTEYVGGLVGWNNSDIISCYANSTVTAENKAEAGGLVGNTTGKDAIRVPNNYFDKQTAGLTDPHDAAFGKTTAEMQKASTFVNWGFDNTWTIRQNESYPYHTRQSAPAVIKGVAATSVTVDLLNDAERVIVYVNDNHHNTLTADNATAGEHTYPLATIATGDKVTVVVYETNKPPSYPVSAVVDTKAPTLSDLIFDIPEDAVYNGEPQPVEVSPAPGVEGLGDITVKYNSSTDEPVNADVYTVAVDIAAGDNYDAATNLELGELTIDKAVPDGVTFPIIDEPVEYGENKKLSEVSLADLGEGDGVFTWKNADEYISIGKHEYDAVFTHNDADNYELLHGSITLNMPSGVTVTFTVADENGRDVADAVVTFAGMENSAGDYVFTNLPGEDRIPAGSYDYEVSKEGYQSSAGSVTVDDADVTQSVAIYSIPEITGIDIPDEVHAATIDGFDIYFDQTVTPVTGGTVSISDGSDVWRYVIPSDADIISGTEENCKASLSFDDFTPFALAAGKTYTISVEKGAFENEFDVAIEAEHNIGSFTTIVADFGVIEVSASVSGNTTYTGYPVRPAPVIQYHGETLAEGADYRIAGYERNISTGNDACVKVEGIGHYTGELNITFTIHRATPPEVVFPVIDYPLNYSAGLTLSAVSLEGLGEGDGTFKWKNPQTPVLTGRHAYEAVFTPRDSHNYDYSNFINWDESTREIMRIINIEIAGDTPVGVPGSGNTEARLYPNPVRDEFTVDNGRDPINRILITDLSGRLIMENRPSATTVKLNASTWPQGVYIITIESPQSTRRLKMIKR